MRSVLGFDTATPALTVAVTRGGEPVAEAEAGPDPGGRPRHASELLPAVDRVVAEAGGWDEISLLAVGVGPGAFTGLRIGIATARALALGRSLPVAGVSSLAALATGIMSPGPDRLPLIDAKRDELFAALYDAHGREVWEPFVASPDEIVARVGGHRAAVLAAGDGSLRFREVLEAAGVAVAPEGDPAHGLRARHVCRLARQADAGGPEAIEPTYLRRPDAELWRERDRGRNPGD